jgi:hypothetical protein
MTFRWRGVPVIQHAFPAAITPSKKKKKKEEQKRKKEEYYQILLRRIFL